MTHHFRVLLLCVGASLVYTAAAVPITYDEAWTYLFFAKNGILTSITHYLAPNHHVFFSVLASLFVKLPFPGVFAMRLLGILATLAAFWVLHGLAKKAAIRSVVVLLVVLMCLYPFWQFAWKARGYALLYFWTAGLLALSIEILLQPRRLHYVLWALFLALGVFTVPTFVHPALTVGAWLLAETLLIKEKTKALRVMLAGAAAVVLVCLLYLPIVVHEGLEALTGNNFVKPVGIRTVLQELPQGLRHFGGYLFDGLLPDGLGVGLMVLVLLGAFLSLRNASGPKLLLVRGAIFLVLVTPLWAILQGVQPVLRSYGYLLIPFAVLTAIVADQFLAAWASRYPRLQQVGAYLALVIGFNAYAGGHLSPTSNPTIDHIELSELLTAHRFSRYYVQSDELDVLLDYSHNQKELPYTRDNQGWWPGAPMDLTRFDTTKTYDCVLLSKDIAPELIPRGYHIWLPYRHSLVLLPDSATAYDRNLDTSFAR